MTPLVLLPGMMCDARLFMPQIAAFSGQLALHLPTLTGAYDMAGLARAVLAQAPPRFALAGLSMGGIVAMEVLRQAPERVERIALLDTNPLAEAEEVKARRGPQMARVRAGGLASVMREDMKPNYLAAGPAQGRLLDLCLDMALGLGADVFLQQSQALMTRPDQRNTLRGARIPALILCGREDVLCPISRHEMMAALMPHARFEIIDDAGHLPTLEHPEPTNMALRRWMEIP